MGLARDGSTMIPRTRLARGLPWAAMFARMVLTAVFAWAGLAKVGDLALSRLTVRSYQLLPEELADLIGNVLPFVELALALLLLVGLGTRVAACLAGLLLLTFIIGVGSLWIRGIEAACGCFGTTLLSDGSPASYPLILARDLALLILAVFVALVSKSRWSVDSMLDRPVPEENV